MLKKKEDDYLFTIPPYTVYRGILFAKIGLKRYNINMNKQDKIEKYIDEMWQKAAVLDALLHLGEITKKEWDYHQ